MTAVFETRGLASSPTDESVLLDAAVAILPGIDQFGGHSPHLCGRCGHVEYVDSEIAGTCVFCPGLVELEPV